MNSYICEASTFNLSTVKEFFKAKSKVTDLFSAKEDAKQWFCLYLVQKKRV